MATITTSMVLLRWPLLSAVLMFLASTLNIQFRKSDYAGSCGQHSAGTWRGFAGSQRPCWASPLLDIAAVWENIKVVMVEAMSHQPPDWPMVIT